MGCDFYISIYLKIEHKFGVSYYELPSRRGWFCELGMSFDDSDDEIDDDDESYGKLPLEYIELRENMEKLCLTPRKDCIVYCDGKFVNEKLQEKYLPSIIDKINGKYVEKYCVKRDTGKFSDIFDILKVTRIEVRYEPGTGGPRFVLSNNEGIEETDSSGEESIDSS